MMINNLGNKIYLSAYIYVNDYLISFKIPYHISPHSNLLKVIVFSSSVGFFQIHNQAKILNLNLMVHLQDIERPASIPQPADQCSDSKNEYKKMLWFLTVDLVLRRHFAILMGEADNISSSSNCISKKSFSRSFSHNEMHVLVIGIVSSFSISSISAVVHFRTDSPAKDVWRDLRYLQIASFLSKSKETAFMVRLLILEPQPTLFWKQLVDSGAIESAESISSILVRDTSIFTIFRDKILKPTKTKINKFW